MNRRIRLRVTSVFYLLACIFKKIEKYAVDDASKLADLDEMASEAGDTVDDADPGAEDKHVPSTRLMPSNLTMNSPKPLPGAPAVGVYRQACSRIPLAVRFVGRDRLLWNSMVQGTQRFRQVRAASCVIPYVLCGCLYILRC